MSTPGEYETLIHPAERVSECAYCGAEQIGEEVVAAIDDDQGWSDLAEFHHGGCEWIETRAHRLGAR